VTLAWVCDTCSAPIADGEGYVCVNFSELYAYRQAVEAWEQAHPPGRLGWRVISIAECMSYPQEVLWRMLHRRCDDRPEEGAYWWDVDRLRSPAEVLRMAAHVLGKNWIADTNLDDLLRRAADQLDPPRRKAA
jgi:hypothetical protein